MNEQDAAQRESPRAETGLVGGHYRIEARLGEGGIASVYRVVDERSGQALALKRLRISDVERPALRTMFELEYHTLVQLAHPHIVRAFDYGLDAVGPYYTMELLDGADARTTRQRGELSVRETCILLRDAASALALIHSRRMVHRDISPRNLWCTQDGRAKLIDFGTLTAMGPQARIAGTPPFVPPEAVYAQPLDGRCDIFALGALAYYLLTRHNAYPAREIADLQRVWERQPQRPDASRADVPPALADLVMAMLNLDVRGRPASAAEVFDRLSAIAELSTEDESGLADAFLTSPKLVGRDSAIEQVRKRLTRAARGRGGTLSFVTAAGFGRTRMLSSVVLEAKLLGAAVISADAAASGAESFELVRTLAERVLEALPMTAAAVVADRGVLSHLSPTLHRLFGSPALAEMSAMERRPRLSAALIGLFQAASRFQSLVVTVDDVHRADGESLRVLAQLATAAQHRLLLAISCEEGALLRPPPALERLVRPASRIEVGALDASDTRELLGSLFGDIPELDDAASWLHELSQGSPQACMQYAQYLVDRGLAHYEGGQWRLPPNLRSHGLPATLDAMFDARVAALSDDAHSLALGLALARDESRALWQPETRVHIEDLPGLVEGNDAGRAFAAIDELLRAGLVMQRERCYVVAQRAMDDALLRAADAPMRARAHARLADIFEQPSYANRLINVWHMQRAGEHARALAALTQYAATSNQSSMAWGWMRLSLTADCAQTALSFWQREGGSPRDGIVLRRLLLLICSVYDWSFARHGDAQVAQLCGDSGLTHYPETDALAPDLERVIECLKRAQQEFDKKPEAERGHNPLTALRELGACAIPLSGAFANSHDVARSRALPVVLEPLRPLSPILALVADMCERAVQRVIGRECGDSTMNSLERLLGAQELPEVLRRGGAAVLGHMQAVEDARCGRKRAFELLDRLVPEAGEDLFLVLHGRWLAHAFRGEAALAKRYRARAEMITEDDVWRRRAFLFVEAQLHALTGNLADLKRTGEAIDELAQAFEGWRPWAAWTRAAQHVLRGDFQLAEAELDAALAEAKAGEHRAWTLAAPLHAEVRLLQGDAAGALREAAALTAQIRALSLDATAAVAAQRITALAQSKLGEHSAARASLDRAFELARELRYEGLPLAVLCEARARTALAADDAAGCVEALAALWALINRAHAPALVHAYEVLRAASSKRVGHSDLPGPVGNMSMSLTQSSTSTFTEVRTRLTAFEALHDRAQQALQLLLDDSSAAVGHLFLFDAHGLYAAASLPTSDAVPSPMLLELALKFVADELGEAQTVADVHPGDTSTEPPTPLAAADASLLPIAIEDRDESQPVLAGVVVLDTRGQRVHAPRVDLVRAIAHCLLIAGDSVGQALDD